jgi:hypothetical protein
MMNIRDAKAGMKVKADGGFTCLKGGAIRTVSIDKQGFPWIRCAQGSHYLNGQLSDEDGTLSGLEPL